MKPSLPAWKPLSTLVLALGATLPACAADTQTWPDTLYRNGGHYGAANSDIQLESPQPAAAAAAAAPRAENPAPGQSVYADTLYRNGGHYGIANSDVQLESPVK